MEHQQQQSEDFKERKYFTLIEKVGSSSRYQIIVFVAMSMINIFEACFIFSLPFLLHQTSYTCPNLDTQKCKELVCKLDPSERNQYLTQKSPFFSLADQMGDYRCDTSGAFNTVQSITFLAQALSMTVFTFFTESLGRKKSLLLSLFMGLVGVIIIFFCNSVSLLTVGVFLGFAGIQNAYQYTYCYSSEVVAEEYRILFVNGMTVSYAIGMMLNSFAFYGFKHWKTAYFWLYLVHLIIIMAIIIRFIEKTPIDLLSGDTSEEIVEALKRIADINGVESPSLDQGEISVLKQEYHQESKEHFFTAIDICRYKSLRTIAVPIMLGNLISNYIFYAPSFIQNNQGDLFLDSIVSGISYLVACLITQIVLRTMERKKSNYFFIGLSIVFACLLMVPVVAKNSGLKTVVFFLFRLVISVYFNVVYLLNYESFPTQIRACAANVCYISAGLAGVIEPWTISAAERRGISVNWLFVIAGVFGFIVNYWLKQTFGIPPPEIVEELHQEHLHEKNHALQQDKIKES